MRTRVLLASLATLALLVGVDGAAAQGKVQKVSKKLLERAEDTLKSIGEAEKQLTKVNERYGKLVGGKDVKTRRNEHGKVRDGLKKLESRAKDVRERSRGMESEASTFFKEWDKGLGGLKDAELQALSRQKLAESQQGDGQVVAAGRSVARQLRRTRSARSGNNAPPAEAVASCQRHACLHKCMHRRLRDPRRDQQRPCAAQAICPTQ